MTTNKQLIYQKQKINFKETEKNYKDKPNNYGVIYNYIQIHNKIKKILTFAAFLFVAMSLIPLYMNKRMNKEYKSSVSPPLTSLTQCCNNPIITMSMCLPAAVDNRQAHQEKQETKDQRAAEDSREKREKRVNPDHEACRETWEYRD